MRELCVIAVLVGIGLVALNHSNHGMTAAKTQELELLLEEPMPDNIPARMEKFNQLRALDFRDKERMKK